MDSCAHDSSPSIGLAINSSPIFGTTLLCPTPLPPVDGPSLKWPYGCLKGGPPPGQVACSCLLPPWTPHAVRLCQTLCISFAVFEEPTKTLHLEPQGDNLVRKALLLKSLQVLSQKDHIWNHRVIQWSPKTYSRRSYKFCPKKTTFGTTVPTMVRKGLSFQVPANIIPKRSHFEPQHPTLVRKGQSLKSLQILS
jgi:hypothetical protein